jgi:hypothetical protein
LLASLTDKGALAHLRRRSCFWSDVLATVQHDGILRVLVPRDAAVLIRGVMPGLSRTTAQGLQEA